MKNNFLVVLLWVSFIESSGFLFAPVSLRHEQTILPTEPSCPPCSVRRRGFASVARSRLKAATELRSTEGSEHKSSPPFSVRVLQPEDLTTLVNKDGVLPNLLEPVSHFCSQMLYGSDALHYSVLVDFQRRYGMNRRSRGTFLIATTRVVSLEEGSCTPSLQQAGKEGEGEGEGEDEQGAKKKHFDASKGIELGGGELLIGCAGLEVLPLFANGAYAPISGVRTGPGYEKELEELLYRPLLSNLAVAQEHRGKGVGKELIRECEAEVVRMGFTELLLKVDHTNEGAYRLYRRLGYEEMEANRLQEDKFVATEEGGKWEKTINISLRKYLGGI